MAKTITYIVVRIIYAKVYKMNQKPQVSNTKFDANSCYIPVV